MKAACITMSKSKRGNKNRSMRHTQDDDDVDPLKNIVESYGKVSPSPSLPAEQKTSKANSLSGKSSVCTRANNAEAAAPAADPKGENKKKKKTKAPSRKSRRKDDDDDDDFFLKSESEGSDDDNDEASNDKAGKDGEGKAEEDEVEYFYYYDQCRDTSEDESGTAAESGEKEDGQSGKNGETVQDEDDPQKLLLWKLAQIQLSQEKEEDECEESSIKEE